MDEYTQQLFMQWLAAQTGAETEEELQQILQEMGQDGLQQAYAQFQQDPDVQKMLMAQQSQAQYGKLGTKINYISRLRGNCPIGYEMRYYKAGGRVCKRCMRKVRKGEEGIPGLGTVGTVGEGAVKAFEDSYNKGNIEDWAKVFNMIPGLGAINSAVKAGANVAQNIDSQKLKNVANILSKLFPQATVAGAIGSKAGNYFKKLPEILGSTIGAVPSKNLSEDQLKNIVDLYNKAKDKFFPSEQYKPFYSE